MSACKLRECRENKAALLQLAQTVMRFLELMDEEMKKPSTVERGKRIAGLCNQLEMANDGVRYYRLGVDYRKDDKRKQSDSSGVEATKR